MAVEWCRPCKERGRLSVARHDVAGTPMCDGCFDGKPSNGVHAELAAKVLKQKREEKKPMAKRIDDETRAAVLKDAADGMSVEAIRIKHHISWPSAKSIVGQRWKPGRRGRPSKSAANANGNGAVTLLATTELCDGIWNALPLEKKAALLNRLGEGANE